MSFETTRSTRAAIVQETTEGTPVSPTSGSDGYIALQEGFGMEPNFESIENAELQGTIGASAPVQGLESPTASLSHYLRHSGVEGTAPNYSLLIESLFGDAVSINGTERTTAAGSTAGTSSAAAILELAAGGTDFARGKAVLIKDGTNGYSIRNVTSVASDSLTLAFNLSVAPAIGIDCGKDVHYGLADTGIPLSLWNWLGDGGAIQMVSGAKVDSGTFNFPAGDAINADYTFVGQSFYLNPIEITSSNKYLDITDDGGVDLPITLTEGMYRDPDELASHIQSAGVAVTAASGGDDFLCVYSSSTGKYTISTTTGTLFEILWSSGSNTANSVGPTIGFDDTADDTAALSYEADSQMDWSSPYSPTIDSEDFLVAKSNQLMVGSYDDFACLQASNVSVSINKEASDVLDVCSTSAKASTLFNGREVSVEVSAYLDRNDISKWLAFKNNETVQFSYSAGRKSSGNWVAGSVVNLFSPTAKISNFLHEDNNGIIALSFTLTCFVSSGLDEFYMNLL